MKIRIPGIDDCLILGVLFLRNLKKEVDKWGRVWYSNQAVREIRGAADRNLKKFKKTVDKRKTVCYNLKVVADKRQPGE